MEERISVKQLRCFVLSIIITLFVPIALALNEADRVEIFKSSVGYTFSTQNQFPYYLIDVINSSAGTVHIDFIEPNQQVIHVNVEAGEQWTSSIIEDRQPNSYSIFVKSDNGAPAKVSIEISASTDAEFTNPYYVSPELLPSDATYIDEKPIDNVQFNATMKKQVYQIDLDTERPFCKIYINNTGNHPLYVTYRTLSGGVTKTTIAPYSDFAWRFTSGNSQNVQVAIEKVSTGEGIGTISARTSACPFLN